MNEKLLQLLNGQEKHYPHALEKNFPHVIDTIITLWGEPELELYFSKLIMDTRDGTRHGFPMEVASEILNLSRLYSSILNRPPEREAPWDPYKK